jgi:hypothetical protein
VATAKSKAKSKPAGKKSAATKTQQPAKQPAAPNTSVSAAAPSTPPSPSPGSNPPLSTGDGGAAAPAGSSDETNTDARRTAGTTPAQSVGLEKPAPEKSTGAGKVKDLAEAAKFVGVELASALSFKTYPDRVVVVTSAGQRVERKTGGRASDDPSANDAGQSKELIEAAKLAGVKPENALSFKRYADRVVVVTIDGQKVTKGL